MVSDGDISAAIVIAIAIFIIALCVWPGFARIRGRSVAGFWAGPRATLYEIQDGGGRAFTVSTAQSAATAAVTGQVSGVRGVVIPALGKKGSLEVGGRRINWSDGESWTLQGVRA